jgi:hypothetical protein
MGACIVGSHHGLVTVADRLNLLRGCRCWVEPID